ncbi:MAG: efflux RND transporter periplasmic adaptor subunit, partial [bacterium]
MKKIFPVFLVSLFLLLYLSGCREKPERGEAQKKEAVSHSAHTAMAGMQMSGPVMIDPELQLTIGIRTEYPAYRDLSKTIRTVGRVEADETQIRVTTVKWEGWVEKLYVDFVGKPVQAGEPLLELYSPELVQAQREYLLALKAGETFSSSKYSDVAEAVRSLIEASRQRLLLWDFTEEKIRLLEEKGEPMKTILFTSPVTGIVLKKSVFEGMKVMPGESLLEIADLSRVWVVADFYEEDASWLRVGQSAQITLPYYPGQVFSGKAEFIYPVLDQRTRTVRVRFSFPNPDMLLKPGMFADISLKVSLGRYLTVPVDSVLDTGTHRIVFVDKGKGHFEPRMLTLGPMVEDYYAVLSGIT